MPTPNSISKERNEETSGYLQMGANLIIGKMSKHLVRDQFLISFACDSVENKMLSVGD